jgi:hypothetical protein
VSEELLLVFGRTAILPSGHRGTHVHILLSHYFVTFFILNFVAVWEMTLLEKKLELLMDGNPC